MKSLKVLLTIVFVLQFCALNFEGQEQDLDAIEKTGAVEVTTVSSTGSGGLWSSSSTWAGGVVPGRGDDVIISPGTAVLIDTDVTVASVTVGTQVGVNVAVLTFEPFAPHAFTVNGNLTVEGLGLFTTPTSNSTVTGHTVSIGGDLTNNGILDLSTNSDQAGAGLTFTNAANSTFGGGGPTTDVRTIAIDKGTTSAGTLTLSVSNFTVLGSSTDTASSGYLTLTNGTFKISGTFSGSHRTFNSAAYTIPASAGFWLDNPNYAVTAQNGSAVVNGLLRISNGTYNFGTTAADILTAGNTSGQFVIEGGTTNVAGGIRKGAQTPGTPYKQSGGTVATCIADSAAPCFSFTSAEGSGGSIVVQTPAPVPSASTPDFNGLFIVPASTAGTTVQFGNAATPGTGIFTSAGFIRVNLTIDTTAGPHTVRFLGPAIFAAVRNANIGAGGILDFDNFQEFYMSGDTFINNGTLKTKPNSRVYFSPIGAGTSALNVTYSGSGVFSSPIEQFLVGAASFTLDPAVTSIRARVLQVKTAQVVNTGRLILGFGDATASSIQMYGTAAFDTAPVFDLGTGGQKLSYESSPNRTTGPEVNPTRELVELKHWVSENTLTIGGGDLTLNGPLNIYGVIDTGTNKLHHVTGTANRFPGANTAGFVKGTLVRKFTAGSGAYDFHVGENHYAHVLVQPTSLTTDPTFVSVKAVDAVLPGLPSGPAASFSWVITQTGTMTSSLDLNYDTVDVDGGTEDYWMWRSTPGVPEPLPGVTRSAANNWVKATGVTDLNRTYGIGPLPGPISISGTVMTSNGAGISNAYVTITGASLPVPRIVQTGPFGTYLFSALPQGTYTVSVSAKRNRFSTSSQVVSSLTSVTDVNFTANTPE